MTVRNRVDEGLRSIDCPHIPEEFAQHYRAAGYWQDETFQDFLLNRFARHGRAMAVVARHELSVASGFHDGDDRPSSLRTVAWTYADLEREARRAVTTLQNAGVEHGDRVLLQLPNTADYLAFMCGVFLLGAVPVFVLPKHRASELEHFARRSGARAHVVVQGAEETDYVAMYRTYAAQLRSTGDEPPVLISAAGTVVAGGANDVVSHSPDIAPARDLPLPVRNLGAERMSENLALLQLSGGTTGVSKLIPRTHADYLYSVRASSEICGVSERTRMLVVLPAAHNFTMSSPGILGVLDRGGSLVLAADPSPQTAFELIARERVTMTSLVPPLAQAWMASATRRSPDLSSLELIQVGGAKLAASVAERIEPVLGSRLQQVFGMAEGLVNYTRLDDPASVVCRTQGRPISPDDEVMVVDDHDRPVEEGETGHLLVRGPYTIRGYYREDAVNRHGFTAEGFYRTGDLVRIHPGGHLEVTGRAKDQINRAGEKIAVDEIEDLVLASDLVADAVVIGIPDEAVGERVGLVVVPAVPTADRQGHAPSAFGDNPREFFREYFRERGLAEFKIPERVEILDRLPLTNVGKVSRRELRQLVAERLGFGTPRDDTTVSTEQE